MAQTYTRARSRADTAALVRAVHGPVYDPAAADAVGLQNGKLPNRTVPWRQALTVRCRDTADVRAAVQWAASVELPVAVRSGATGWIGAPPESLLLDLRDLKEIAVDAASGRVRAGGGTLSRDIQAAAGAVGLAIAGPQLPLVGAGYALGGGRGWLTGSHGWGSDNLLSVSIVSASGDLVRASADENADLFWAIRGAGSNFGVAVTLDFEPISLRDVTFGTVVFASDAAADAMLLFRDWVSATEGVTASFSIARPLPGTVVPDDMRDRPCPQVTLCHRGTEESAIADLSALVRHPRYVTDTLARVPWTAVGAAARPYPPPMHMLSTHEYVREINPELAHLAAGHTGAIPGGGFMDIYYNGTAVRSIPEDATAIGNRHEKWCWRVTTSWSPDQSGAKERDWLETFGQALSAHATGTLFANYLNGQPDLVRRAYSPAAWQRLRHLKGDWDPSNLFRVNNNVPPATPRRPKPERNADG